MPMHPHIQHIMHIMRHTVRVCHSIIVNRISISMQTPHIPLLGDTRRHMDTSPHPRVILHRRIMVITVMVRGMSIRHDHSIIALRPTKRFVNKSYTHVRDLDLICTYGTYSHTHFLAEGVCVWFKNSTIYMYISIYIYISKCIFLKCY